jgi:hypothetical protein
MNKLVSIVLLFILNSYVVAEQKLTPIDEGDLNYIHSLVSFRGTLEGLGICTADCGNCCTGLVAHEKNQGFSVNTHSIDSSLSHFLNDSDEHLIQGYFYQGSGSCGMNQCTFFKVTAVDPSLEPVPNAHFSTIDNRLQIKELSVDNGASRFSVSLEAPYHVTSLKQIMAQTEECSGENQQCDSGLSCLTYFGFGGNLGPSFSRCEIACNNHSNRCPLGQQCITIADGPGPVCR